MGVHSATLSTMLNLLKLFTIEADGRHPWVGPEGGVCPPVDLADFRIEATSEREIGGECGESGEG